MIKFFLAFSLIACLSVKEQNQYSQLELNFTSRNGDTIRTLKSFYLTRIPKSIEQLLSSKSDMKPFYFLNVECVKPNKFILDSLNVGLYRGLFSVDKKGSEYNIIIDSIEIKPGLNVITKELNLGTVKL